MMRSSIRIDVDDANALNRLKEHLDPRLFTQIQDTIHDFYQDMHRIDERLTLLTNDTIQNAQSYIKLQALQQQLNDSLVKINRKADACRNLLGDSAKAQININAFLAEVQTQVDMISADCKELTTIKNAIALIPNQETLTQQLNEIMQELMKVKLYLTTLYAPQNYAHLVTVVTIYNDLRNKFNNRYNRSSSAAEKLKTTMTNTLNNDKQARLRSTQITLDREVVDCQAKVKALFTHVRQLNEKITSQRPNLFQASPAPAAKGGSPSNQVPGKPAKK